MSNVVRKSSGLLPAENQLRFIDLQSFNNIDIRLPPPPPMDEGTPGGAGGGENSGPQFSGRQIGVVQSFSQIMGFLDRGGMLQGKPGLRFAQHLAVFPKFS